MNELISYCVPTTNRVGKDGGRVDDRKSKSEPDWRAYI